MTALNDLRVHPDATLISLLMQRDLLAVLLASALSVSIRPAAAQDLPYFFTGFEAAEGYAPGPLASDHREFQLLQGSARLARQDASPDGGQWLETDPGDPYPAIFLTGDRISANGFSHLEVWTRPFATDPDRGEEFIDFNGSVLGFFREGDSGTVFAYHTVSDSHGFWISTGFTVSLDDDGAAQDWIRFDMAQDLLRKTWDLSINGSAALTGINHSAPAHADSFELWLYGHQTGSNRFDDILISPLPPDVLENALKARLLRQTAPPAKVITAAKPIGRSQPAQNRRNHHVPLPDTDRHAALRFLGADFEIVAGGRSAGMARNVDIDGEKTNLLIYSPLYDDDGNPLPLTTRVTCSAGLTEGSDLGRIEWVLTEFPRKGEPAKVIARGNFEKGLTLDIVTPVEWARKATSINVGTNLKNKIRSTGDGEFLLP